MNAGARRRRAFAGGCLAGIGLGWLASIFNNEVQTILLRVDGGYQDVSPKLWLACLAIGIGLGVAFAARIPDDPEP